MGRTILKIVAWAISVPWVWGAGMIPVVIAGAVTDFGRGEWIGWGTGIAVVAALVTAGVVHEKIDEMLAKK